MDMMQILSGAPAGAGPLPGKMPAAESKGIFGVLLSRQQAAAVAGKTAEEVDPTFLAAWWTAAVPADVSSLPVAVTAGEGMGDSMQPSVSTESTAAFPGLTMLPDANISGRHPSLSGAAVFADRQGAEGLIPGTAADKVETDPVSLPNHDHQARPGLLQSSLPSASVPMAAIFAGTVTHPEIRVRAAAEKTAPPGVMEHRFAELLRPVEMTFARGATGAGQPVQDLPHVAGALTPAGEQTATGLLVPGEFLPGREATILDGPPAEIPGFTATGDFSTLRPPAVVAQPTAAETLAAKQPFPGVVNESQILDQVVGRMAVERNQDVSRMTIKLQPEELGRIEIDLTVEQGRLKAQMVAQTQQVQEVLERHLPRLREALEQHGLKLDQIQVSVDSGAGDGRGFSRQHHQAEHHPRTWSESRQPSAAGEKEEIMSPAVSTPGRVSLRI